MPVAQVDLRRPPERTPHGPLWHLNTVLATPLAWFFGMLGIAAGQLSLQSVTLTCVGLLRAASGAWGHLVTGALIVYLALLVDRADDILQERGRTVTAWGRYLGLMADRLIDAGLVVSLGWLSVTAQGGWEPLGREAFLVLVAAALGALLVGRLANVYGDLLVLRIHLANTRRLPGPSAVPQGRQVSPLLSRLLDRDFFVAVWVVGVMTRQFQLAALVVLATQALVVLEGFVLFFQRRRDPEPRAAHVLARGP